MVLVLNAYLSKKNRPRLLVPSFCEKNIENNSFSPPGGARELELQSFDSESKTTSGCSYSFFSKKITPNSLFSFYRFLTSCWFFSTSGLFVLFCRTSFEISLDFFIFIGDGSFRFCTACGDFLFDSDIFLEELFAIFRVLSIDLSNFGIWTLEFAVQIQSLIVISHIINDYQSKKY